MINMYGTTETTVHAAFGEIVDADADGHAARSVGRWRILAFLCWMGGCGRCRRVWSASCMSPVPGLGCGYWRRCAFDRVAVCGLPVRGARERGHDVSHRGSGVLGC